MSMAKKCDRCGAFYEHKKEKALYSILARDTAKAYNKTSSVDLCPGCIEKFDKWLREKQE